MAIRISAATRTAMLDAIVAAVGNQGKWEIWDLTGAAPDPISGTPVGTKCATLNIPGASGNTFGTTSNGVLTCTVPTADTNTTASPTGADYFRVTTSGGTVVLDGTVGTTGTDLVLNSTAVTNGGSLSITAASFTAGNA